MILNDLQLSASQNHLSELETWIEELESEENCSGNQFRMLELKALEGFATNIRKDIEEYNALVGGNFKFPETNDLSVLPRLLIQTRIFRGWSQDMLAQRTSTPIDDLRRYEENCYLGASLSKKMQVATALKIDTSACFRVQSAGEKGTRNETQLLNVDQLDFESFHTNETFNRGWVTQNTETVGSEAFRNWFSDSTRQIIPPPVLHQKKRSNGFPPDVPSIWTWQVRILQLANSKAKKTSIPKFSGDERWLKNLVATSAKIDGPARVKELLLEQGIIFLIERPLPMTYLDGAALLSHDGYPVVALTLRYNRLDYFWYTLFHELAHVYLHLFSRHHYNFFDREILSRYNNKDQFEKPEVDEIENEADQFALKKLIARDEWDCCQSRRVPKTQNVISDANRLKIHPSIIAGRIRKERNDNNILGNLLGQSLLHQHFDGFRD